jgi:hypothetical protein
MTDTHASWSPVAPLPDIYPGRQFLDETGLVIIQAVFPNLNQVCFTQGRGQEFLFLSQEEFVRRFGSLHIH